MSQIRQLQEKQYLNGAKKWAALILECAPLSVRASKEAAMRGLGLSVEEAQATRFEGISTMVKSKDFIEGPLAFSQKRAPSWQGK